MTPKQKAPLLDLVTLLVFAACAVAFYALTL